MSILWGFATPSSWFSKCVFYTNIYLLLSSFINRNVLCVDRPGWRTLSAWFSKCVYKNTVWIKPYLYRLCIVSCVFSARTIDQAGCINKLIFNTSTLSAKELTWRIKQDCRIAACFWWGRARYSMQELPHSSLLLMGLWELPHAGAAAWRLAFDGAVGVVTSQGSSGFNARRNFCLLAVHRMFTRSTFAAPISRVSNVSIVATSITYAYNSIAYVHSNIYTERNTPCIWFRATHRFLFSVDRLQSLHRSIRIPLFH